MTKKVKTSVKNTSLIEMRREQMIKAAVALFTEKGFHRTTTREIAQASGFSIGTLYEYIRSKEDVLFLVCDDIYNKFKDRLEESFRQQGRGLEGLRRAILDCVKVMDEMQDEVLVMYQEAKSLSKDALPYVLNKEMEMVKLIERLLEHCATEGQLLLSKEDIRFYGHHILVQCQMWAFRRWGLRKTFTREAFADALADAVTTSLSTKVLSEKI
ncbi:AcrR family transcriptional regulator [Pullulanibacillus pueri]|uniref:TetR family transcriptional regulator n=1 Tax=Pullulanibacillus pueri TaxID=1437324 RepID=A0A8J3ENL4_9BACL|nr:TetR/AcrR family transcriptional regulator [Pullulanibacillus pueri]MBM7681702.1 AcrR family transcriptional regulator [Pullulanibacillus pueri]GGH87061.1 TetR family transcriptional regulator [Pullulanibacillus pueri]